MSWFKRQERCPHCTSMVACTSCGAAFDPKFAPDSFMHLCPEHRKAPMERARKVAVVREWAERNVETLYEEAYKENAAFQQAFRQSQQLQPIFGNGGGSGQSQAQQWSGGAGQNAFFGGGIVGL